MLGQEKNLKLKRLVLVIKLLILQKTLLKNLFTNIFSDALFCLNSISFFSKLFSDKNFCMEEGSDEEEKEEARTRRVMTLDLENNVIHSHILLTFCGSVYL